LRPLVLGEILDGTVKLIRSNPKATLGLSAIVGLVTSLPLAIGDALYFREGGDVFTDPASPESASISSEAVVAQTAGSGASLLLTFVATTILTGMLTRVLGRAVFGERTTVGEAWRMTRSRVGALLGLALLVGLVVSLPGVLLVGVLVGVGVALDLTALVVVGVLVGLTWLVYAVFMGTRLTLAPAALVLERLGVVEAMRRSWRLVRTDTWRVFGIIFLTQILIALIGGVVSFPFGLGSAGLAAVGPASAALTAAAAALTAVGQTVTATVTYPFTAGVYGLLYADRRMRAEAFDLTLQTAAARPGEISVDDLWQPPSPGPPPA
jgi:hypothetical protein